MRLNDVLSLFKFSTLTFLEEIVDILGVRSVFQ